MTTINTKNRMKEHVTKYHVANGDRPFWCRICLFWCETKADLLDHVTAYERHRIVAKMKGIKDSRPFLITNPNPYVVDEADMIKLTREESQTYWMKKEAPRDILAEAVKAIETDMGIDKGEVREEEAIGPLDLRSVRVREEVFQVGEEDICDVTTEEVKALNVTADAKDTSGLGNNKGEVREEEAIGPLDLRVVRVREEVIQAGDEVIGDVSEEEVKALDVGNDAEDTSEPVEENGDVNSSSASSSSSSSSVSLSASPVTESRADRAREEQDRFFSLMAQLVRNAGDEFAQLTHKCSEGVEDLKREVAALRGEVKRLREENAEIRESKRRRDETSRSGRYGDSERTRYIDHRRK